MYVGLEELNGLLKVPAIALEVIEVVSPKRGKLKLLDQELMKLSAYKSLHDVLQTLEIQHYPVIDTETKKLREAVGWDAVADDIEALRRLCKAAERGVNILVGMKVEYDEQARWVGSLKDIVEKLGRAVEQKDDLSARRGVKEFRILIRNVTPDVNSKLRNSAESLPLENLILTLAGVASIQGVSGQQRETLNVAKANLESLRGNLRGQVAVHNQWQDVEPNLWAAADEFARDPPGVDDFKDYWSIVNQKIEPLWNLDPSAEWVQKTVDSATKSTMRLQQLPSTPWPPGAATIHSACWRLHSSSVSTAI